MSRKGQLSVLLKGGPTLALILGGILLLVAHFQLGWDSLTWGIVLVILGIAYSLTWKFF